MKQVICYEDIKGRRHDTPEDAAKMDRIHLSRQLARTLIAEWTAIDQAAWMPSEDILSVILQRLAKSKGFAVLRKVQAIQRKEARILAAQTHKPVISDDIPF